MPHISVLEEPVEPGVRLRRASRVLLLDPEDRVLLARYAGRRGPTWIVVGGGVDPGETDEAAALREVAEETGATTVDLGPEIARFRFLTVGWDGRPMDSRHRIWLGRCAAFEPHDRGHTDAERAMDVVTRWWTAAGLAASTELFEPDIPALVAGLLRDGPPPVPQEITVDGRDQGAPPRLRLDPS